MSNPEFSDPGPEETSLPHWYQLFLEAKERLQTQDSTILELTQKFEEMETRMRVVCNTHTCLVHSITLLRSEMELNNV
jgi:hypothetical protein